MSDMFDPVKYAQEPTDSKQDNELLKWIHQLDDEHKFTFVWRVLNANAWKGCKLVKRSQPKPIFLEVILEKGLVYGDASSIRWWIEAVIYGLGHRRVLKIIKVHIDIAPLGVHNTLYWLPMFYNDRSEELQNEVRSLEVEFEKKYPNYQPSRSKG